MTHVMLHLACPKHRHLDAVSVPIAIRTGSQRPAGTVAAMGAVPTASTADSLGTAIAPRARGGRTADITIKGTLTYQACDDSICYAPVSVPVAWTVAPPDRASAGGKSPSR